MRSGSDSGIVQLFRSKPQQIAKNYHQPHSQIIRPEKGDRNPQKIFGYPALKAALNPTESQAAALPKFFISFFYKLGARNNHIHAGVYLKITRITR